MKNMMILLTDYFPNFYIEYIYHNRGDKIQVLKIENNGAEKKTFYSADW